MPHSHSSLVTGLGSQQLKMPAGSTSQSAWPRRHDPYPPSICISTETPGEGAENRHLECAASQQLWPSEALIRVGLFPSPPSSLELLAVHLCEMQSLSSDPVKSRHCGQGALNGRLLLLCPGGGYCSSLSSLKSDFFIFIFLLFILFIFIRHLVSYQRHWGPGAGVWS